MAELFSRGDQVNSKKFGMGKVELDLGQTVIVRFEHGIEECEKTSLAQSINSLQTINQEQWHIPLEVIAHIQAEAIQSVNDKWGIFSRSRMALLPHQLWVCRRVLDTWPTRWLVADDVGLGKTIEAGLILWPVIARNLVKRLLIICPAPLVEQWQYRLRTMFDIRLTQYMPDADTSKTDFWNTHNQVIASLQTMRLNLKGRHQRLFEAEPWDLLIVDEAHHLNADEDSGVTLGYKLVARLVEEKHVSSVIFFTATPHRGKNYGFLSLLQLLRPDLFDPTHSLQKQLQCLSQVVIRNNKQNVTDLKGNRLFQEPKVSTITYAYSDKEAYFYRLLTHFITSGKAYASTLSSTNQRAVTLVLIAMQKLASSSVAAIRRALNGRLHRINSGKERVDELKKLISDYEQYNLDEDDEINKIEEQILELSSSLKLKENEEDALHELIQAANIVGEETKIEKILAILKEQFPNRSILFFTEYKATQSLLMSALIKQFGNNSVTFINGDDKADDVICEDGKVKSLYETRESASEKFNAGQIKFLVSTEAAGEGIDLQENCHSLIHVDLPWNPMRLHQRAGRLNRFGQTQRVEIILLRNPDTVESLIWEKLNNKIEQISLTLGTVMEEPEDLKHLVLGMTSLAIFREIFSEATSIPKESLSAWFDQKTVRFGGQDVVETVKSLVGHCSKFDFQAVSALIPQVDLPDLKPFLTAMLMINHRQVNEENESISFITPDVWRGDIGVLPQYQNLIFNRHDRSKDIHKRLLGVGHKLLDLALVQAKSFSTSLATVPEDLQGHPLYIFRVHNRLTSDKSSLRAIVAGVQVSKDGINIELLQDWQVLKLLNSFVSRKLFLREPSGQPNDFQIIRPVYDKVEIFLKANFNKLDLSFKYPDIELISIIWPV